MAVILHNTVMMLLVFSAYAVITVLFRSLCLGFVRCFFLHSSHFMVSVQVLHRLDVFDDGDLDAAAEALDDVIFCC